MGYRQLSLVIIGACAGVSAYLHYGDKTRPVHPIHPGPRPSVGPNPALPSRLSHGRGWCAPQAHARSQSRSRASGASGLPVPTARACVAAAPGLGAYQPSAAPLTRCPLTGYPRQRVSGPLCPCPSPRPAPGCTQTLRQRLRPRDRLLRQCGRRG